VPIAWASFPVRDSKDNDIDVVGPKDDIEGKPAKDRPARSAPKIGNLPGETAMRSIRQSSSSRNRNRGAGAPLGVPSGGFLCVPQRRRVEADGPLHQPLNGLRS
jgi:hypothetical protein